MFKLTKSLFLASQLLGLAGLLGFWSTAAQAKTEVHQDVLVRFYASPLHQFSGLQILKTQGAQVEPLDDHWVRIQTSNLHSMNAAISALDSSQVEFVQPNYKIVIPEDHRSRDPLRRAAFARGWGKALSRVNRSAIPDNPEIPLASGPQAAGPDPLFENQWGMIDIGVKDAWSVTRGSPSMIVAVLDTGVDYTHEDLLPSMWRNAGETGLDAAGKRKESNGVDDDANGFIDDVLGWDFVSNDNKPYDLTTPWQEMLKGQGNPGHGTHCAGNIAAKGNNSIGISGVAPDVKIMALRFISEKGSGNTSDAIKAIKYAVDNGAKVLSNSWGSEGEDASEAAENRALRESVQYAQDHGVLFIAAAGNGHDGSGYDNDTDPKPSFPASYPIANIISVAALDKNDHLGSFSNWGAKTVHIGAPGVAIYSSMVGNKYSDKVLEIGGFDVDWNGTSMATPHVAGAAALYWSAHPTKTWQEVKSAIVTSAKKIPALAGKTVSEGKLDVRELLKH